MKESETEKSKGPRGGLLSERKQTPEPQFDKLFLAVSALATKMTCVGPR